jgi:protein-S-isoprenylcysteine O-methyltransferase Ste14
MSTTAAPVRKRVEPDWGRIAVVPLFTLLLAANVLGLRSTLRVTTGGLQTSTTLMTSLVMFAFYVVVIVAYLRRGRATATTCSAVARVLAVVATCLPLVVPLLGSSRTGVSGNVAATMTIIVGTAWSVWALKTLGRNISVFAQARGLVTAGPYTWVRHPVYVGEIVATFGIALRSGTAAVFGLWLLLVLLQVYRAVTEERLLAGALPGYDAYLGRTARFVPGVSLARELRRRRQR